MLIGTIQQIWRHPVKSMAGEQLNKCFVGAQGIPGDRGWALRDETTGEITNGKRLPLLMQCAARYRDEPTDYQIPPVAIVFPDGSHTGSDDPKINSNLSDLLGRPVSLWPLQPAGDKQHYRRKGVNARITAPLTRIPAFRALLPQLTKFGSMNRELREFFSREPDEPVPDISVLPADVLEFTSPPGTYFDAFPIHLLTTASLETMARFNSAAIWDVRRFRPNFFIETDRELHGLLEAGWAGRNLRLGGVELKCEIPTVRCGMTTHAQSRLPKDPTVLRSIVKDADQNLGIYASVQNSGEVFVGDPVELL